jgi:hypothetical protein
LRPASVKSDACIAFAAHHLLRHTRTTSTTLAMATIRITPSHHEVSDGERRRDRGHDGPVLMSIAVMARAIL